MNLPMTCGRRPSVLAVAVFLALAWAPASAQPVTLTPDEIASLKARLPPPDGFEVFDADYRQEVVDVVSVFRRHGAMSPGALRDLNLRYVPLFDSVVASDDCLRGSVSVNREGHLAYSATVRLRLQTEAALTGAWILRNCGVPRAGLTEAERIKAGIEALDHGLAYIVAHELAHKELGHNLSAASSLAESRDRELAADRRAFEVLWQVRASLPLLRELLRVRAALDTTAESMPETSSFHPHWSTRVTQLDRFLSAHPPDPMRGGLLVSRRWTGNDIEEELIVLRGGPPRWLGNVSSLVGQDSAPSLRLGYLEQGPDGRLTLWTRQGRAVERREIEPIPGEVPGWMRIRTYQREENRWALQNEARGLVSSLVRTPPGSSAGDLVSLYASAAGADLLSGVPPGQRRELLRVLQQQHEEELRRTMQSFCHGDFGLLEFADRTRLTESHLRQLARQQGVGNDWDDLGRNFPSTIADTSTGRGLGAGGLEILRQLAADKKVPLTAYSASDGRIEFRLPGQVERMDVAVPAGSVPGSQLEAYASVLGQTLYAISVVTLPYAPSPAESEERMLNALLGAQEAMGQGHRLKELDRRAFELGSTKVLEAAVQLDQEPVVFRLRFMAQGRYMVCTTSVLGSANEYDVIDGWRVLKQ